VREKKGERKFERGFCCNCILAIINSTLSRGKQLFLKQELGKKGRVSTALASSSIFHLTSRAKKVGI
jgi:hypothetical protein